MILTALLLNYINLVVFLAMFSGGVGHKKRVPCLLRGTLKWNLFSVVISLPVREFCGSCCCRSTPSGSL